MTTYSIIQKSQLEGAQRIDAEYYQPEERMLHAHRKSKELLDQAKTKIEKMIESGAA